MHPCKHAHIHIHTHTHTHTHTQSICISLPQTQNILYKICNYNIYIHKFQCDWSVATVKQDNLWVPCSCHNISSNSIETWQIVPTWMINLTCTCWWMNEYYIKFAWWVLVQCPELFYIHPSPPTHTHKCTPMYNLIIWHSCYFGTWGSSVHNFWLIYWFCDFYLQLSGPYRAHQDIKIASQDPKMSKTGIAGKRKRVTSTIPQKL